jgi:hypothetical protein
VLEGQARKDFEKSIDCKEFSDALIKHETVHANICEDAYRHYPKDPAEAYKILDTPENVAESEVKAYRAQKEALGNAIRGIIARNQGCGWVPTPGQQAKPLSVPSAHQTAEMEKNAWKAAKALGGP